MSRKEINILIAGGSGLWAEKNHHASIVALKNEGVKVRLVAICDPINPRATEPTEVRDNLKKVLEADQPRWIDPSGLSEKELLEQLDELHQDTPLDGIMVASDPVHHFIYCKWALIRGVDILCDKPLATAKNSSFDVHAAQQAQDQYEELLASYRLIKRNNPKFLFCTPLKLRAFSPYIRVAESLQTVFNNTNEGLRHVNVIVNGGIHKYPAEYTKGGAHGHLDGVGTLAHSSYHYIDVIAWYLSVARGKIETIELLSPYVLRVGDYLKTESFSAFRNIIEDPGAVLGSYEDVPPQVLKSELDFSFLLILRDKDNNKVGTISYIVNYSSFAPRTVTHNPHVTEYAHDTNSGRMSSVYFDIHQGPLQQWQIIKNDEVARGHVLELRHNVHPGVGMKESRTIYDSAHRTNTVTTRDLSRRFIEACGGAQLIDEADLLSTIEMQSLTNRIYTLMYQKIAEEYSVGRGGKVGEVSVIKLDDYL